MDNQHKKENVVAIVVNQAFVHYAIPLINSIKRNWTDHPKILLFLASDVELAHENWFSEISKVVVKRFDPNEFEYRKLLDDRGGKFDSKSFNDAGFFIMNFWSNMFSEYNNVLILDADMLVLKDLSCIMADDNFLGVCAANERILPVFSFNQPFVQKVIKLTGSYIKALSMGIILLPFNSMNSGVIRIGVDDRTTEKYETLLRILKSFRKSCIGDQEIILLWMKKYKKNISTDFRMNFQARFLNGLKNGELPVRFREKIMAASKDIHILHFNGAKPDSSDFLKSTWTKGREDLVDLYKSYL